MHPGYGSRSPKILPIPSDYDNNLGISERCVAAGISCTQESQHLLSCKMRWLTTSFTWQMYISPLEILAKFLGVEDKDDPIALLLTDIA